MPTTPNPNLEKIWLPEPKRFGLVRQREALPSLASFPAEALRPVWGFNEALQSEQFYSQPFRKEALPRNEALPSFEPPKRFGLTSQQEALPSFQPSKVEAPPLLLFSQPKRSPKTKRFPLSGLPKRFLF